jgi:hypothetical protein
MFVSHAADRMLSGSVTSAIFDMLAGALTDIVGILFLLYLVTAVACILLAFLLRARKRCEPVPARPRGLLGGPPGSGSPSNLDDLQPAGRMRGQ